MSKLTNEDKKFLLDQLKKERMATALEAILLQMIVFSFFILLNMTGLSNKFSVSAGLIYILVFIFSIGYSIMSLIKNKKRIQEAQKIEKSFN
ncbi:MAG: hypothetical protein HN981_02335 [Candidatus Pacebacteria bacterium]|mgnify:CR=1 FL=1|jgi:hypothetical protein|nr:hypothetical protein [Candidatus Paceibacterota bacterium]MBT4651883.1 hypothetical protein [Candidatus Paceibacterota bacterium]MBT6755703.1 hypothetical protein [Candidatus Paceibacterota bacterium]MBT6921209.1 hypothetical protein [Candidatus Paceibacterota bacterium]